MPRQSKKSVSRHQLMTEPLERRQLLANIIVTTPMDVVDPNDGLISLREAATMANSNPDADTITFSAAAFGSPTTITLTAGSITLEHTVTVTGPAAQLTISGNNADRIFIAEDESTVTLNGLRLTQGEVSFTERDGGAIFGGLNSNLTVNNSTITGNTARLGGGIISIGSVTLNDTVLSNNTATGLGGVWGGGIGMAGDGSLVINGGSITGNTAPFGAGVIHDGPTTLNGVIISGNNSSEAGGGVYFDGLGPMLSIINSTISDNTAQAGAGILSFGFTSIVDSTVSGNTATLSGGGMYFDAEDLMVRDAGAAQPTVSGASGISGLAGSDLGLIPRAEVPRLNIGDLPGRARGEGYSAKGTPLPALSIVNSTFTGNTATFGGGFIAFDATAELDQAVISGNSAGRYGGGILTLGTRLTTLDSRIISNTIAATFAGDIGRGGGIALIDGSGRLERTEIANNSNIAADPANTFGFGGGLYLEDLTGIVELVNSTLSGNSADVAGAGVVASFTVSSSMFSINSTITQNTVSGDPDADVGGVLLHASDPVEVALVLLNSVFAGNLGATINDVAISGDAPSANYTLIAGGSMLGSSLEPTTPDPEDPNIYGDDPMLGALTFNGGPTRTHAPLAGSPLIDAGDNDLAIADPGPDGIYGNEDDILLTTDQRGPGFVRVSGGVVDIGSYEVQGADVDPPFATATSFHFETGQRVVVTFNENVVISATDLDLYNANTGALVPAGRTMTYDPSNFTATFTFSPLLAMGNYQAVIPAGSVVDDAGNATQSDIVVDFFILPGDANRDRSVNLADLAILRSNFGQSGRTFSQGDFNYDGVVNLADLAILRQHFGVFLAPPSGNLFGDGDDDE